MPKQPHNDSWKKNRRIASLIARYIQETLTPAEHDELDEWVGASDINMRIFEELTCGEGKQQLLSWIGKKGPSILHNRPISHPKHHYLFSYGWHYAVAASLVWIIGICGFLVYQNSHKQPNKIVFIEQQDQKPSQAIPNKTTEIKSSKPLRSGSRNIRNGNPILQDENIVAEAPKETEEQLFNSVRSPRAGNYSVILADGTKVWLNAASFIQFPRAFKGHERRVTITGEVYFEVANNDSLPFIINVAGKNSIRAETLGANFNINAYDDEPVTKITLVKGTAKITASSEVSLLQPSDEARLNENGLRVGYVANANDAIAWKDGIFRFRNVDLATIMRAVSRRYDVDISFEHNVTNTYSGSFSMNEPMSSMFAALRMIGDVEFKMDGKKVMVIPKGNIWDSNKL